MLIQKPIITEKSLSLAAGQNAYTFEVSSRANKDSAAQEFAKLFSVDVLDVRVLNKLGREVRFGKTKGRRNHRKVMIFKLKEGQKIAAFEN